jgi:hypothetical protein
LPLEQHTILIPPKTAKNLELSEIIMEINDLHEFVSPALPSLRFGEGGCPFSKNKRVSATQKYITMCKWEMQHKKFLSAKQDSTKDGLAAKERERSQRKRLQVIIYVFLAFLCGNLF